MVICSEETLPQSSYQPLQQTCEALYRQHHAMLIGFARQRGCDEHEAWDAVQDLFVRLLQSSTHTRLITWAPEHQRAWLLCTLRRLIHNQHRDRTRIKRGSGLAHESLEGLLAEGIDIPTHTTPATEHDRRWALGVVERGLARLRHALKPAVWTQLESELWDSPSGLERPVAVLESSSAPTRSHDRCSSADASRRRVARHRARTRLRQVILRESSAAALLEATAVRNCAL